MIMVFRFRAVLGGWLVDAFESSSPSKSAQSLPGQPVPVRIQCIRVLLIYYLRIIIIMLWSFTLQEFCKCRHTKSVPIMGLKFRKRAHTLVCDQAIRRLQKKH